jgi:hypothetical protein
VEHAEPELERTARRLRRGLLAFRVVFYGGAALLVLLLLPVALNRRATPDETTWLEGTNSHDARFALRIDRGGQPGRVTAELPLPCGDGKAYWLVWWPYGPFRLEGDTLSIRETKTHSYRGYTWHRTVTLRARVTGDSASGTIEAVERLDDPSYGPYSCESGPVAFSASAR